MSSLLIEILQHINLLLTYFSEHISVMFQGLKKVGKDKDEMNGYWRVQMEGKSHTCS